MAILKYTQGDTRPPVTVSLRATQPDKSVLPIDVSGGGDVVRLRIRPAGSTVTKATLIGIKRPGWLQPDGTLDMTGAYAVSGRGGQVEFPLTPSVFDAEGSYEGEIEITFGDSSIQTVWERLNFDVQPQFGG